MIKISTPKILGFFVHAIQKYPNYPLQYICYKTENLNIALPVLKLL